MLGLIIWGILIIWIACACCPGFITICCITFPLAGLMYYFLSKLFDKFSNNSDEIPYPKEWDTPTYYNNEEIEEAKDEWEKKWGRKHPTRLNTPEDSQTE